MSRRPERRPGPVVRRATRLLEQGDLDGARRYLVRERWFARDRGDAALLLFGCHVAAGEYAAGIDVLRSYLAKTPATRSPEDAIVERLLRHHAAGGGLKARSDREATYFGLYALRALKEPETADPDLERARAGAPRAERALLGAAGASP